MRAMYSATTSLLSRGRQKMLMREVLHVAGGDGTVEAEMADSDTTTESLVLQLLSAAGVLTIDELVQRLPSLNWSSVFRAVDALSRRGDVLLRKKGFQYEVSSLSAPMETEPKCAPSVA